MDPLTHTLTGLALSRAGLNRLAPYATPVALLAANAADIDIVTLAGGWLSYVHFHRHITHALVSIPLMAFLSLLVVRLFARKAFDWKRLYLVSLIAAASHPILDFTNAYGIRLLLPFSSEWLRLDIFNLVDLWIWAVLLLATTAPMLGRLVSSEIGAKPGTGRGWAFVALSFLFLYGAGRSVLHSRAVSVLEARIYAGAAPVRVAAFPRGMNPFRWRGLVETDSFYSLYDLNLLGDFDPSVARTLYKPEMSPRDRAAADAARRTAPFRVFVDFSAFPFWRFEKLDEPEGATRVEAVDLRFGSDSESMFAATAVVDARGQVIESYFGRRREH